MKKSKRGRRVGHYAKGIDPSVKPGDIAAVAWEGDYAAGVVHAVNAIARLGARIETERDGKRPFSWLRFGGAGALAKSASTEVAVVLSTLTAAVRRKDARFFRDIARRLESIAPIPGPAMPFEARLAQMRSADENPMSGLDRLRGFPKSEPLDAAGLVRAAKKVGLRIDERTARDKADQIGLRRRKTRGRPVGS